MGEWGLPIGLSVPIAVVIGFVLGALTEVVLIRPVSKRSPFAVFIVTIGLFQGLNWLDGAIWGDQQRPNSGLGDEQRSFPTLFPSKDTDFVEIFGAAWRYKYLGILALVLVLTALLFLLFNKTKIGLAMRAVASNPESSRLVGMRTNTVLMFSWGLAAAIGALGAIVFAGTTSTLSLGLMFTVFIYGSAAATLGGFDSPGGAVVAGLSIGVIENLAAGYVKEWIGQELRLAVAFVVILAVLLVKPSGLFGTAKVERV
jgi:branched-chain amino acid transport system permease protein